jgi:hypothetical protein
MSVNGNTTLSPEAQAAIKRVLALREFTRQTGFATVNEQANVMLALSNEDLLAAAKELKGGAK